jgi:hypothetical protein
MVCGWCRRERGVCALRGIVKLQALVRGQLVRKQANATLRRKQALLATGLRFTEQLRSAVTKIKESNFGVNRSID